MPLLSSDLDYGPEQYVNVITAVFQHWGGCDRAAAVDRVLGTLVFPAREPPHVRFVLTDIPADVYAFTAAVHAPADPVTFRTPGEWGMLWAFKPGMFADKSVLFWPQQVCAPDLHKAAETWPQPWALLDPALMGRGIVFDPPRCAYLWNDYMADPEGTRQKYGNSVMTYIWRHREAK